MSLILTHSIGRTSGRPLLPLPNRAVDRGTGVRYPATVDPHELEILRRSVAMLPPGHSSAGAIGRESAEKLLDEIDRIQSRNARYERLVGELRKILAAFEATEKLP